MRKNTPTKEKFWGTVSISGDQDCWIWKGPLLDVGYGIGRMEKYHTSAHRLAWISLLGDIEDGMEVAHICSNKACCNPAHLYLSTHKENMREVNERSKFAYPLWDVAHLSNLQNKAKIYQTKRLLKYGDIDLSDGQVLSIYKLINENAGSDMSHDDYQVMGCGHSSRYVVSGGEGTQFCLYCEFNAYLSIINKLNLFIDSIRE